MNVIQTKLSQTKSCSTIQLYDISGIYSSVNNIGGYNTPNLPISGIQYSTIQLAQYLQDYVNITVDGAPAQGMATGTVYNITNTPLNQPQTDFTPDIYQINYIVFWVNPKGVNITFSFTSGSNIVNYSYVTAGTDPQITGMSYFNLNGDSTLYQVASVSPPAISGSNSIGTITLTANVVTTQTLDGTKFYNGFSKLNYIDATCTVKNCVAANIANLPSNCSDDNQTFSALAQLFAIQSNMSIFNYARAQEIVRWLVIYCQNSNCYDGGDCGCH